MTNALRYAKPHGEDHLVAPRMGVWDVYARDRDDWARINAFFASEKDARDWIDRGCPELSPNIVSDILGE